MKELKRTAYTFRASIIGSRDQLCIHPELREIANAEKPFKCKDFRAKNKCEFHKDMKSKLLAPELRREVLDIEDLVRAGKKRMCCPYYAAREISKGAQLVFMPYNVSNCCLWMIFSRCDSINSIRSHFMHSIWSIQNYVTCCLTWKIR